MGMNATQQNFQKDFKRMILSMIAPELDRKDMHGGIPIALLIREYHVDSLY